MISSARWREGRGLAPSKWVRLAGIRVLRLICGLIAMKASLFGGGGNLSLEKQKTKQNNKARPPLPAVSEAGARPAFPGDRQACAARFVSGGAPGH